jgi:EAL domain-containing protein (putative c-di-GMP-specific phosphodiesterase class I)
VTLEITESVLMRDTTGVVSTLNELKALGVQLALDDFGTGYSSLSYLHRFPIDILKVDRSFVNSIATDPESLTLVRTVVQLGQTLNLHTVAEGIEDVRQEAELRRLGCDSGQGYLYARPLDAVGVSALLATPGAPAKACAVGR